MYKNCTFISFAAKAEQTKYFTPKGKDTGNYSLVFSRIISELLNLCLQTHESGHEKKATKQNFQKLTSRISVVSKAIKVSVQSYFRVLKVTVTDSR